jgi:hypothetical protein
MEILAGWTWKRFFVPPEIREERGCYLHDVMELELVTKVDPISLKNRPLCLITGDAACLPKDVRGFENWDVPHDLYCVNRSLLFHQRQVDHWAAIDIEESAWFTQYLTKAQMPKKMPYRHTIADGSLAFDIYWQFVKKPEQWHGLTLTGSSGYFALLTALYMGYEKIVLAGMPLDRSPHWYDDVSPTWGDVTYIQWMDFKMKHPLADRVRSLSGYSSVILGTATKEWVNG